VQLLEYISTETSMYYDINQQMNFSTTYDKVHDLLGRQRGPGVKRLPPMSYSYNIITGEPRPSQVGDDYRLTSGNRVLHSARHSDQGQLLILG